MSTEKLYARRDVPQSDPVNPKDFMMSWSVDAFEAVQLKSALSKEDKLQCIAGRTGIDEDTMQELAEITGPQSLLCGEEPNSRKELLCMKQAPGIDLECVKYQIKQKQHRENYHVAKLGAIRNMKYSSTEAYLFPMSTDASGPLEDPNQKVPVPNVVLTVQVSKCVQQGSGTKKIPFSETFEVLGSQTLAELRDVLKCPVDNFIAGDYSTLPDLDPEMLPKAGEIYKSSFFFIENVFYNDLRLSDNKDYSQPIIEWAKEQLPNTELKKSDMSTTKLFDLTIRLGYYYLFMHQGNCEHSVLFQDMRLFSAEDIQDVRKYPIRSSHLLQSRKVCQCCTTLSAQWAVFESPLIPTDPCFLCKKCFKALLYDKDGQKTSNFRAHHYTDACV